MAKSAPDSVTDMLREAVRRHRAGALADAAEIYERTLMLDPLNPEALHLSGLLAHQQGRHGEAALKLDKAVAAAPSAPEYRHSRGQARRAAGDLAGAEADFLQATLLNPKYLQGWVNLGVTRLARGDAVAALEALRPASALAPQSAEVEAYRGTALVHTGALTEAIAALRRAVALDPTLAEAHYNLGAALERTGDDMAAERAYRRAATENPLNAKAWNNLALALDRLGRGAEARACFERGLSHAPPGSREATELWNNLALRRGRENDLAGAIAAFGEALAAAPDNARIRVNYGDLLLNIGDVDGANAEFARAHELEPALHVPNRLLTLLYRSADGAAAKDAAFAWAAALPPAPATAPSAPRAVGRRLRLGYVSPDFFQHVVPCFIEPVLEAHDRTAIELFAYAETRRTDATTARLRGRFDHWRDTRGLTDAALAERIRADGIDVLVDLAGHTTESRLSVFALRPAPLQLSWIGYPATTGLAQIDWRVTDALADPLGLTDGQYAEKLLRLPGGFNVYRPLAGAPAVGPSPAAASGVVTFGSFNHASKIGPETLDLWAELMRLVPGSRLLIKHRGLSYAPIRAAYETRLLRDGVDPVRVELMGFIADGGGHLAAYNKIDVALDSFPYCGTTTTAEALWMGVPVVTLAGAAHHARVGASMLTRAGLPELVAQDKDAYLAIAADLAGDTQHLAALRAGLRARVAASPLRDAAGLTREFEAALLRLHAGAAA